MKKIFVVLMGLCWMGCSSQQPEPTQPSPEEGVSAPLKTTQATAPVPSPKPEAVQLDPADRFSLDTEQELYSFPVEGASHHELQAHLADSEGRRSLSYLRDGVKEVLAEADFHLPPVAAVNRKGESLACFNRLVGKPSERTAGSMPDPTQGVHLYCRFYDGTDWRRAIRLGESEKAAWTQTVTALQDGSFRVIYVADEGWLMDFNPRHSIQSQLVKDGVAQKPVLVRPYTARMP